MNTLVYWMNTSVVGSRPYLWGLEPNSPENLRVSDPLRCNSKRNVLPTLYLLDLYISMIHLYISFNEFNLDTELSKICVSDLILNHF